MKKINAMVGFRGSIMIAIFAAAALFMAFFGINSTFNTIKYMKTHPKTQALVVDIVPSPGANSKSDVSPKITYFNKVMKIITFVPRHGTVDFLMPKINDKVDIYYDENDPDFALINTFGLAWFMPIFSMLGCLICIQRVFFFLNYIKTEKEKERKEYEALNKI